MGVSLNTLLSFLVCQILLLGSISGLPFASISSIPSLTTTTLTTEEPSSVTSNAISNSDNTEGLTSSTPVPGTLSSKSCQLFIGSPDINRCFFSSQNPAQTISINNEEISTSDISNTRLFTSYNLQSNIITPNAVPESSSSLIDANPDESTPTSTSLSIIPSLNVDFNSGSFKREMRDTVSVLEPCLSNTRQNFATSLDSGFTQNYVTSPTFSSFPLLPSLKPIFPCLKMPVNLTQASNSEDTGKSSNVVKSDCLSTNTFPCQHSSLLTNNCSNSATIRNKFLKSQDNSNILTLNSINKRITPQSCSSIGNSAFQFQSTPPLPNGFTLTQNPSLSSSCTDNCEIINNSPSGSLFDTLSSFTDVKKYINSRQSSQLNSGNIQNQPSIDTNNCPCQLSNNLMYAKALQNKIASERLASQILTNNQPNNIVQSTLNNEGNCANIINQNSNLAAHSDNIVRIRNNVIPSMQFNNAVVKNVAENTVQNNNDNYLGCPQLKTVTFENNVPYIQNNNIVLNPTNNGFFLNNNDLGGTVVSTSLNNIPRILKNNNLNQNDANNETPQSNNLGCPQLMSIPIYNRDSLLNKQIINLSNIDCSLNQNNNIEATQTLQNNNVVFNNNNNAITLHKNNQGCQELLAVAQNNLYARKICDTNTKTVIQNQNMNCLDEVKENVKPENNCNTIQTFTPNDNLVQALRLINQAKLNQAVKSPATSINILPYGQTVIDGTPVPNNFFSLDSMSSPVQSICTDSCHQNDFLTIQDVSLPLPSIPVNPYSYCAPSEVPVTVPTNIILTPPFTLIDTESPLVTNILPPVVNLPLSSPNLPSITFTETPTVSQPFSSFVSPNFISVQSLPQVSFVNNIPFSTISGASSVNLPDNFISSISNLPSVCTSIHPPLSTPYLQPLITANLPQANSVNGASALVPSLNNAVSALTQNIISTLISKIPATGIPLALPPVNSFTPTLTTESTSVISPFAFDILEPATYAVSTPVSLPRLSLPDIPVACNEYLPPAFDSCTPFTLSQTDAYYPEISLIVPTVGPCDCTSLCGPLFMPASSLPQSSSVIKMNNAGCEAKGFEQLIKSITM